MNTAAANGNGACRTGRSPAPVAPWTWCGVGEEELLEPLPGPGALSFAINEAALYGLALPGTAAWCFDPEAWPAAGPGETGEPGAPGEPGAGSRLAVDAGQRPAAAQVEEREFYELDPRVELTDWGTDNLTSLAPSALP